MSEKLLRETVFAPDGKPFVVSTIRTLAGGAPETPRTYSPFQESDYLNETPWPFETLVLAHDRNTGLYHEAYATEADARAGHNRIVQTVQDGLEFPGETVSGPFGNPTLTAEQWRARTSAVSS